MFAAAGILTVDEPARATADFNWLLMGEPVNRAMMLGAATVPGPKRQRVHAEHAVAVFLSAYA